MGAAGATGAAVSVTPTVTSPAWYTPDPALAGPLRDRRAKVVPKLDLLANRERQHVRLQRERAVRLVAHHKRVRFVRHPHGH